MTDQIKDDVETLVDIEDIKSPPDNKTALEPINEKPISFEALKEQVKEQENEQVKEQVIKEETNTESSKCVKTDKNTVPDETKPRKKNIDMKAKTTCPDCGMSLTVHSLKYTHGRYCKSKKEQKILIQKRKLIVVESACYVDPIHSIEKIHRNNRWTGQSQ